MRLLLAVVFALVACGSPAPSTPSKSSPAAVESVEEVATRLARAAYAGDHATALRSILTYQEAAQLTSKAAEKGEQAWKELVTEFLDQTGREGREGREHGLKVVGAKTVKTMTLSPGESDKVLRTVDVAIVHLDLEVDGRVFTLSPFPLIFLKTAGGWKLSPTQ